MKKLTDAQISIAKGLSQIWLKKHGDDGMPANAEFIVALCTEALASRAEHARKDELLKRLEVFVDRLAEGYDTYWNVDDEKLVDDFRAALAEVREGVKS